MMQRHSLKSRILDHAETRLLEQGFRGMRVDELARDVGISKRTLYEQFRTKEEMAREALARLTEGMHAECDRILAETADEAEQLRAIVLLMCRRYSRARPPFYRDLETTPVLTELIEEARRESYAKIDGVIQAGIERGRFRADLEPRLVRMTLLAACDTIIQPQAFPEQMTPESAYCGILDVILNGVLTCESKPAEKAAATG